MQVKYYENRILNNFENTFLLKLLELFHKTSLNKDSFLVLAPKRAVINSFWHHNTIAYISWNLYQFYHFDGICEINAKIKFRLEITRASVRLRVKTRLLMCQNCKAKKLFRSRSIDSLWPTFYVLTCYTECYTALR